MPMSYIHAPLHAVPTDLSGVWRYPLRQIEAPGGPVLHMLRADSPLFRSFGEVYFSVVQPRAIKAWKLHHKQSQFFSVPIGRVHFVLYDNRPDSLTYEMITECTLGRPDAYDLLIIPPGIWYGFQGVSEQESLIANCPDLPHEPSESEKTDINDTLIPYTF